MQEKQTIISTFYQIYSKWPINLEKRAKFGCPVVTVNIISFYVLFEFLREPCFYRSYEHLCDAKSVILWRYICYAYGIGDSLCGIEQHTDILLIEK